MAPEAPESGAEPGNRWVAGLLAICLVLVLGVWASRLARRKDPAPLPDGETPAAATYRRVCSRCHGVPQPGTYTAAEWEGLLEKMKLMMEDRGLPASKSDLDAIRSYLGSHARDLDRRR